MLRRTLNWIRDHPVRTAVYGLLMASGIFGALTVRGISRGERNELLTRVARWNGFRGWVEREFRVRYSLDEIAIRPECGLRILAKGVKVELVDTAAASLDTATVCLQGVSDLSGLHIGRDILSVGTVRLELPGSVNMRNVAWRDREGEIVAVNAVEASANARSLSFQQLRIAGIASIRSVTSTLAQAPAGAVLVQSADVHAVGDLVVDQENLVKAVVRVQTAARSLAKIATAASALPPQWSATAQRWLLRVIVIAAALLLVLKAALTRAPKLLVWRTLVVLAPFGAFPLIALTRSWVVIAIAAAAIPFALWAVAYRRAIPWHRKWEPAAVDVAVVALGLPLLVLWSWPAFTVPAIPTVDRVSIAQLNVHDVDATLRQQQCGPGDLTRVAVDRAGASQVRIALTGSTLGSLEIERVFATGNVQTQAFDSLRPLGFLPEGWKKTTTLKFCVTATVRNGGGAKQPESACTSEMLAATAAVDYAALSAVFAADWRGMPQGIGLRGFVGRDGVRIDHLTTAAGAPLRIANGSGRIEWPKAIAARFQLRGVEGGGVTFEHITAGATLPMACGTGPVRLDARAGNIRYLSAGSDIRILDAAFDFARPARDRVLANVTLNGLSVGGPIAASLPKADFRLEGSLSHETIPRRLDARVGLSAGALEIASPIAFTADLWNGLIDLPNQAVALTQSVTARLPATIAMELGGSGALGSIATPVQARADFHLTIPQLVPALGPADLRLNGLQVKASWDTTRGLAPLRLASDWSIVRFGELPSGFSLDQISRLHLATTGIVTEAPAFESPRVNLPSVPRDLKFRLEGNPQAITLLPENGAPILIDEIDVSSVKASLAGLKLQSLEAVTRARVERAGKVFPVSVHAQLTDTETHARLSEPLGVEIAATDQEVSFALLRPLDTARLLEQVGLDMGDLRPKATLASLKGRATFSGVELSGGEVSGAIAPGTIITGKDFEIAQDDAATFQIAAPSLPKASATVSAPAVRVSINGGKQKASLALDTDAAITLAPGAPSPVLDQLIEAGKSLMIHAGKGTGALGEDVGSNYPLAWDLDVHGNSPVLALAPDKVSFNAKIALRRLDVRQQTIDGALDLSGYATQSNQHLILDIRAPGNLGLLGRRFQLTSPLLLSLRKELLRGAGNQLFDLSYHATHNDDKVRVAVGYGNALQFATSLSVPFFLSTGNALAQAQINWQPSSASVDSYGTFSFRGLEAGRAAFPNSVLEDRLNGDAQFETKGLVLDRLLLPQLLSDASRVSTLDRVTLSLNVTSAGDNGLQGITQSSTGMTVKPASALLRLLAQGLNLQFPPRALFYKTLALDFRVRDGVVETTPVFLTLGGVELPGVNGLLDSDVRVHWGRIRDVPPPRLRDLLYTVQRVMEQW